MDNSFSKFTLTEGKILNNNDTMGLDSYMDDYNLNNVSTGQKSVSKSPQFSMMQPNVGVRSYSKTNSRRKDYREEFS
jgi:hypothetical protein